VPAPDPKLKSWKGENFGAWNAMDEAGRQQTGHVTKQQLAALMATPSAAGKDPKVIAKTLCVAFNDHITEKLLFEGKINGGILVDDLKELWQLPPSVIQAAIERAMSKAGR